MAEKKKKGTPEEQIQETIASMVVDGEYATAKSNQNDDNLDFESLVDMLEGKRNEKEYQWMSDYSIPELISIIQTNASGWAAQYFPTRDFVEVKLDGDRPDDANKARAVKKLINKILNDRDLYYYQKYIRLRLINALHGRCYVLCWWEQELKTETIKTTRKALTSDPETKQPQVVEVPVEEKVTKPIVDRFNFEVIDPRNVFMDNKYSYTTQQKDWVIIRGESDYGTLKSQEKTNNYFNLDKVKEAVKSGQKTDTERETYGKDSGEAYNDKTPVKYFDTIDRYGKFWAVVVVRDSRGNATKVSPGIDEDRLPLDNAELIEMIITHVLIGNHKIMIRFEPTPNIASTGKPFKPVSRGLCYIHPVKDNGLSDGRNMKELQIALDDNFNMGIDRVKLATMPTLKVRKNSMDDMSQLYFEPEHPIEVENMDDIEEIVIRDNITGAMNVQNYLTGKLQQVTATYPTTMGAGFDKSGTTATEVAGTETRTNQRENYKSLTFEYTFLTEFYWMIIQMAWRFAHDDTLMELMGEDVQYFDGRADYSYSPLSSNIEQEYNKYKKIQLYDQGIGRLSGMVQALPKVVPIIAHMVGRQFELQGDEFQVVGKMIDDLAQSKPQQEGGAPDQVKDGKEPPTSNQAGLPVGPQEADARSAQMIGGMMK